MEVEYPETKPPVLLSSLSPGDTFVFDVDLQDDDVHLYLLTNDGNSYTLVAVELETGQLDERSVNSEVHPVNSVVKVLEKL